LCSIWLISSSVSPSWRCSRSMPAASVGSEAKPMVIPILALLVAFGLAIYLVVTLIAPERF